MQLLTTVAFLVACPLSSSSSSFNCGLRIENRQIDSSRRDGTVWTARPADVVLLDGAVLSGRRRRVSFHFISILILERTLKCTSTTALNGTYIQSAKRSSIQLYPHPRSECSPRFLPGRPSCTTDWWAQWMSLIWIAKWFFSYSIIRLLFPFLGNDWLGRVQREEGGKLSLCGYGCVCVHVSHLHIPRNPTFRLPFFVNRGIFKFNTKTKRTWISDKTRPGF